MLNYSTCLLLSTRRVDNDILHIPFAQTVDIQYADNNINKVTETIGLTYAPCMGTYMCIYKVFI